MKIIGIDFPFSLPEELVKVLELRASWADYVHDLSRLTMNQYIEKLNEYKEKSETGKKHLFREIDCQAKGCSPMMMHYTPVGRMFLKGHPFCWLQGPVYLDYQRGIKAVL